MRILLLFLLIPLYSFGQVQKSQSSSKLAFLTPYGTMIFKLYDLTPNHQKYFSNKFPSGDSTKVNLTRVMRQFSIMFSASDSITPPKPEITKSLIHKRGALSVYHGELADSERKIKFFIVLGKTYTNETIKIMEERTAKNYSKNQNDTTFSYTETQIANYIYKGGAPHLDGKCTVIGEIISGWEVMEKLEQCPVDQNGNPIIENSFSLSIIQ